MAKAPTYRSKWPQYAKLWDKMAVNQIEWRKFAGRLQRSCGNKDRYLKAEKLTGVPWYMIAALHWRESSGDFRTQLAQGDPLNRVSTHVPRGRGPFKWWEAGAYDALVTLKKFNKMMDWRLEKILFHSEATTGGAIISAACRALIYGAAAPTAARQVRC